MAGWTRTGWTRRRDCGWEFRARPLLVDGQIKEFVVGPTQEVTERTFVVQRTLRINDALPEEKEGTRWRRERSGWLLVSRTGGRITPITLSGFDPFYSISA